MKTLHLTRLLAFCLLPSAFCLSLRAQGNAFTYQGRLADATGPANGNYDFRFTAYNASTAGASVGTAVTTNGVAVSNGLFTVALDLGTAVFTGPGRWLQIEVRTNGATSFSTLTPRQSVTPSPYALYAPSAGTATLASTVAAGAVTPTAIADGAVTTSKIGVGAVKRANIDDGGAATFEGMMALAGSFATGNALTFEELSLVSSNASPAPSLAFTLDGADFGTVLAFTGHEGMSEPCEYVVLVQASHPEVRPEDPISRPAHLTFLRNNRSTRFGGIVTGCSVASQDGSDALYTFRIESQLAYLALSTDCRIYQDISVPDVVAGLYQEVTSSPLNPSLAASYPHREYVVQFAETDLSFFNRLLEGVGIFYFCDPEGTTPILGDDVTAYRPAPNSPFRYHGNAVTNLPTGAEFIRTFQNSVRESTMTATTRSYNFKTPAVDLTRGSSSPTGRGDHYEFGFPGATSGDLTMVAGRRRERFELERATICGSANAPDLRPGHVFALDDRTDAGLSGEYVVTAVRHGAFRRVTNGVAALFYGNQFEVIPAALTFRPALKTPKPQAQASTAKVTGPAGQEIYVDSYGRAKVQFHWDRRGVSDERSSAWLRPVSPWAGQGWGMVFLPRVGQEVMVEFLNGDPDQPVITGSFYNAVNVLPYVLPGSKTVSTIKTRSSPGGTAGNENEIRFDDLKGAEKLEITAEKDFTLTAGNNTTLSLGNDTTIDIGRDLTMDASRAIAITAPAVTLSASQGIGIGTANDPTVALKVAGTVSATSFQGAGSALTGLSATALTGTINDAQLSANVALLNAAQAFTALKTFSSGVRLNGSDIYLLSGSDTFHGLGWYGTGKLFAGVNVAGPTLYGWDGGALATKSTGDRIALRWDNAGRVGIGKTNPSVALDVAGSIRTSGALRSGSEADAAPATYPSGSDGLVLRRISSGNSVSNSVVARTDALALIRDGTPSGLMLAWTAASGPQNITCRGVNRDGSPYNFTEAMSSGSGLLVVVPDSQHLVHYDISFGNVYNRGHTCHVVLDRFDDGTTSNGNLVGTLTSTYNQ